MSHYFAKQKSAVNTDLKEINLLWQVLNHSDKRYKASAFVHRPVIESSQRKAYTRTAESKQQLVFDSIWVRYYLGMQLQSTRKLRINFSSKLNLRLRYQQELYYIQRMVPDSKAWQNHVLQDHCVFLVRNPAALPTEMIKDYGITLHEWNLGFIH